MTEHLLASIATHPYMYLFVGLIFGGETALLPALYLGAKGVLDTVWISLIMIAATLVSDTVWYFVGLGMSHGTSCIKLGERMQQRVGHLAASFDRRSVFFLFLSKFVYGTRTAAQILCGMRKMPMKTYIFINTIGVISITILYVAMMHVIVQVLNLSTDSIYTFQIGLAVSVVVIVLLQIIIGYSIKKKWLRRS